MNVKKVFLWGFDEYDLRTWPADLVPASTPGWPPEGPVVVHSRALEAFQAEVLAHPLPDGRLPQAILYLPASGQPPAEAWGYFDAAVHEGEWDTLRGLLACPRLFEMEEAVEDMPTSFLAELARPVRQLRPEELPLPQEMREHLAICGACRHVFDRAAETRLRWRRQLLCPSLERLAAYVRGTADPQVTEHLRTCRSCQAEASVLRWELAPAWELPPAWLELPLSRLLEGTRAELARVAQFFGRQGAEALAVLIRGLQGAGLVPAGAQVRRVTANAQGQPQPLVGLLEQLRSEGDLYLARAPRELRLSWDAEAQALRLDSLSEGGEHPIEAFRVQISKGEEVLWQGDSREGQLTIPLSDLTRVLEQGADKLVVLAYQEPV